MIRYLKGYMLLISIFCIVNVYPNELVVPQAGIAPGISVGKDLKAQGNNEQYTVFNRAIMNNKVDVIQKLLDMNTVNVAMVLDAAVKERNIVVLEYLLQKEYIKGDCMLAHNGKEVSLMDFVLSENTSLANLPSSMMVSMIKNGANINTLIGQEKVTPLFKALQANNVSLFETLLTQGANPEQKNQDGVSVISYLKNNKASNNEFCSLLSTHGVDMLANKRGRKFTIPRKKIKHLWGKSMTAYFVQ